MKIPLNRNSRSVIVLVRLLDTSGAGVDGLSESGMKFGFFRPGDTAMTDCTFMSSGGATVGTYAPDTDAKVALVEIDATDHPGVYELHLPNNMLKGQESSGRVNNIAYGFLDHASIIPCSIEVPLTNRQFGDGNPYDKR